MKLQGFIVLIILFFIYRFWFSFSGTLSSGDWPYLYKETIEKFPFLPQPDFLWLAPYYQIPTKILVQYLGISWEAVERLLWFWPFLLLTIFSSYHFTRSWIGVLIYTTNTYILMVVGGGQMGIALAYSLAPLVLRVFIDLPYRVVSLSKNFKLPIISGVLFGILTMFDPRIAYVTAIATVIYMILSKKFTKFISVLTVVISITLLINSFWIVPLLKGKMQISLENLDSLEGFKYLSFADFSHAFSLLHPNWPENIFGKVYFLQPEFLILPLIAFLSLVFFSDVHIEKRNNVLYFSFLAILGTFLAKGANQPFGEINLWLFEHIPGMGMFRDSSKFYLLIILGYSFLIPLSLEKLSKKIPFGKLIPLIFILFWCILIRQAIFGELDGTFKPKNIPDEYVELKQYVLSQPQHSSSLWIPSRQRFGFSSNFHLGISASDILGNSDPLLIAQTISSDKDKAFYNRLKEMRVEHIIVPYDSNKELFMVDRRYSDSLRDKIVMELDKIAWLIKMPKFGEIAVYRVQ